VSESRELLDIARDALACGALDCGGPLSPGELALAKATGPPARGAAARLRTAIRDGGDPLGERLCEARSRTARRSLGAFYTGPAIVDAMIDWALERRPDRFVDAGCGSGRFAVVAARRNPALQIVAIDVDPFATLIARAAFAAIDAKNVRVIADDYLHAEIGAIAGRTAFVGNPPYVRHHQLSAAAKARASALALRIGSRVSGLAGLHVLFYLATLALHGKRGDVGSFVTNAEWLDVGYGSFLRRAFAGELGGRSLVAFDPLCVPFAGAMTTAAIATFRIGSAARFVRLGRVTENTALSLERGRRYERSSLARAPRWSALVDGRQELQPQAQIGSLFRVSRGQVTGANDFFVMSKTDALERGIAKHCVPLIASAKEVLESSGVVRDSPERLVGLEIGADADIFADDALARYLRAGEAAKIHLGYVASRRRKWYALAFPRPPVVGTYMARRAPGFACNPDRLGLLNVVHGLHPRRPLEQRTLASIVASLNASRASFVGRGRTYHGGLEKFEPREMEALPLRLAEALSTTCDELSQHGCPR
jgi:predicted RNA methylase